MPLFNYYYAARALRFSRALITPQAAVPHALPSLVARSLAMDSDSPVAVVSDSPVVELQDSVPPESVVVPKDDSSLLASEMVLPVLQFLLDSESLDYVPDSVAPDSVVVPDSLPDSVSVVPDSLPPGAFVCGNKLQEMFMQRCKCSCCNMINKITENFPMSMQRSD